MTYHNTWTSLNHNQWSKGFINSEVLIRLEPTIVSIPKLENLVQAKGPTLTLRKSLWLWLYQLSPAKWKIPAACAWVLKNGHFYTFSVCIDINSLINFTIAYMRWLEMIGGNVNLAHSSHTFVLLPCGNLSMPCCQTLNLSTPLDDLGTSFYASSLGVTNS